MNQNLQTRRRIYSKIGMLKENPVSHGSVGLRGTKEEIFRIRIGDYRFLYEVDSVVEIIGISKLIKMTSSLICRFFISL